MNYGESIWSSAGCLLFILIFAVYSVGICAFVMQPSLPGILTLIVPLLPFAVILLVHWRSSRASSLEIQPEQQSQFKNGQ